MKLKISYDNAKDKFYFDYDDGTLETFYGLYAAIENLHFKTTMDYSTCEKLLINNCDDYIEIEI